MVLTLKADRKDDLWVVTDHEGTQKFKDLCGGIGYGNPGESGDFALNAIVVVGLQTDDRLNAIAEFVGEFDDLINAAIDIKDLLLLDKYYLDPNYEENRRRLNAADGLTQYRKRQGRIPNRNFYVHDQSYWPHFRDRDNTASLMSVHDDVLEELDSSIQKLQSLIRQEKLLEHPTCTKIKHLNRQNFKEGRNHPLVKAYVYATFSLAKQLEPKGSSKPLPEMGYPKRW
jgi:hypothetical protein